MSEELPEVPRLSPSIAKIMIERSPLHAYQAHRLLGGGDSDNFSEAKDRGNILESIIFNAESKKIVRLDYDSFRTKEAQNQRDAIRAIGSIPVLEKDWSEYEIVGLALRKSIMDQGIHFNGGDFQKLVEWESIGVPCKGYLDYYQTPAIFDLKTTSDASPKKVQRLFTDMGWDIQAAAYREAVENINPDLAGRVQMLFIVCEIEPPYCVQLYEPDGIMRSLGEEKWDWAKKTFRECTESGEWPGYFQGIGRIGPTPWAMNFEQTIETEEGNDKQNI